MRFFATLRSIGTALCVSILLLSLGAADVLAQDEPLREAYLTPPESIEEEVIAPRHENVTLNNKSPNAEYFLNTTESGLPQLSYYAREHYNIAGLQIDPQANRARWMSTVTDDGLERIDAETGDVHDINTPDDAKLSGYAWSPDGTQVAYFAHYDDASHVYVADLESGESTRLTDRPALPTLVTSLEWSGDSEHVFAVLTPEDFGEEPAKPAVPTEPQVRKTTEDENRLRTYQSLLENSHEAELLEYYTTGQLTRIDVDAGDHTPIGEPSMIRNMDAAPSGEYVRVETIQRPFSYIVPVSRFAWNDEIWDLDGDMLATVREADAHLGVPDVDRIENFGREDITWRPDGDGLSFVLDVEAREEEDDDNGEGALEASAAADENDDTEDYKVVHWQPPFGEEDETVIYETENEPHDVHYSDAADILFLTERPGDDEHLYAVFLDDPEETYTIYRHDRDDFYDDPGSLVTRTGSMGVDVVRTSPGDEHVYLSGTERFEDYDEEAPRPFLDRVEIESEETERLFQSSEEMYEDVLAVMDDEANFLTVERENPDTHPDSWRYDRAAEDFTQLTDNVDHNEAVTQAERDRFKVERSDGFEFWVEVIVPQDWDGEELPGLLWHYPREYDDQDDYNESARWHNKNSFPSVGTRTPEILVKEGYAVIRADWPIAGERGSSNDNFVWSIVQNSTTVIDEAERRGYIDRDRLAIGGHSYGAFGTANAMIHTSFFRAGIAGNGNYNRTLTPMGFQREPADLWRGQDRYLQMSPIFWVDRLDGALLMYHGEEDQNVGTWPTNSERMLHAMNGIGKTGAMYMYPHEGHGPSAEATLLDLWRRWADWLDHYVKDMGEPVSEEELAE